MTSEVLSSTQTRSTENLFSPSVNSPFVSPRRREPFTPPAVLISTYIQDVLWGLLVNPDRVNPSLLWR